MTQYRNPKTGEIWDSETGEITNPVEARDVARASFKGMTFGFGDEISSATAAFIAKNMGDRRPYREIYEDILSVERMEQERFEKQHPVANLASEMAGGVATGQAGLSALKVVPGVARAATSIPHVTKPVAVGAGGGAAYGAGTAKEGERLKSAGEGAIIGSVAGPLSSFLVNKIGIGGTRWLYNALAKSDKKEAKNLVIRALKDNGYSRDEAVAELNRLGGDSVIADLGGQVRNLARTAHSLPIGPARKTAEDFFDARDVNAQKRLWDAAKRASGSEGNLHASVKTLSNAQKNESARLYAEAYRNPVGLTDALKDALKLPQVKGAWQKGRQMAQLEAGKKIKRKKSTPPTTQDWDWIQRGLRAKAMSLQRNKKDEARAYFIARSSILDELDDANPAFANARSRYASQQAVIDAAEEGQKFMRQDVEELAEYLTGLTESEKQAYLVGASKAIKNAILSPGSQRDISKIELFRSPLAKERLGMVLGQQKADKLLDDAMIEAQKRMTKDVITTRSPTADILAGQRSIGEGAFIGGIRAATGDPVAGAAQAAQSLFGGSRGISPEVATELSRILLTPGAKIPGVSMQRLIGSELQLGITPLIFGAQSSGLL